MDLKSNGAITALRANAAEATTAPFIASLFDTKPEAVGEKAEGVKQGAFANPVLPNYSSHWSQWGYVWGIPKSTESYILQHSVILDSDAFDYRQWAKSFLACTGVNSISSGNGI